MKLAILHSGDLNGVSPGGVDRYVKSLITGFEDGEVTLFGTTTSSSGMKLGQRYSQEYEGKNYTFVPISYDDKSPLCVYYALSLPKYFKSLSEFDCIYAQRIEYSIPFAFSTLKKRLIQMIHGSSAYSEKAFGKKIAKVYPWFEKRAISIAANTYVILNREEYGVPYYKRRYPKLARKIKYGRNPIDCAFFEKSNKLFSRKKLNIDNSRAVVSFIGRVCDNPKRVLSIPDICEKVKSEFPNVLFMIVGDGEDLDDLKQDVHERGLQDNFFFSGYESNPERIRDYIASSDLTINLSHFEGTCTSVLESLACGVPVLATDVGDIHEVVSDGKSGSIISNDGETVVDSAAEEMCRMLLGNVKTDAKYLKYDLQEVIEELRTDIDLLGEAD